MSITSGALIGSMDLDHIITVMDAKGRVLQRISGIAGRGLRYEMPFNAGVLLIKVQTSRGMQMFRVNPH